MNIDHRNKPVYQTDTQPDIIRILYLIGFLDLFAISLLIPLNTKHFVDLGASPFICGIMMSLYGLVQLFSSPFVGHWSDLSGRRTILLYSCLVPGLCYLASGYTTSLLGIFLFRFILGMSKHNQSICKAYLTDVVHSCDLALFQGRYNSLSSAGFMFGPLIGGHLFEWFEPGNGYFVVATVTFFIYMISYAFTYVYLPDVKPKTVMADSQVDFRVFINTFQKIPWKLVLDLLLIKFLLSGAVIVYRSNITMILDESFSLSPKIIGYLMSYLSFIGFLAGFAVGQFSSLMENHENLQVMFASLLTVTLAGLTLAKDVQVVVLLLAPLALTSSVLRVLESGLMIERMRSKDVGSLIGATTSVMSLARIISPLVGGMALEYGQNVPGMIAVSMGVSSLVVMLLTRGNRLSTIKID